MSLSERRLRAIADGDWWRDRASCKDMDSEIFFSLHTKQEAVAVCQTCPVNNCCLDYALEFESEFGIWGGFTARQRVRYRRELKHYAAAQLRQRRWGSVPELRSRYAFDEAEDSGCTRDDCGLG